MSKKSWIPPVTPKKEFRVGQRVNVRPGFGKENKDEISHREGKIIYIHPLNRYCVVDLGIFRESYYPEQIIPAQ